MVREARNATVEVLENKLALKRLPTIAVDDTETEQADPGRSLARHVCRESVDGSHVNWFVRVTCGQTVVDDGAFGDILGGLVLQGHENLGVPVREETEITVSDLS